MRARRFMALALAVALGLPAFSQAQPPILRIAAFTGSGLSDSEVSTLERLVASCVVELRLFRVIDDAGRDMALAETETALSLGSATSGTTVLTADYILTGNIGKVGDVFVFTLDVTKVATGERISFSDTAHSLSDIVLRSRDLTRSLFGKKDGPAGTAAASPSVASATPAASDAGGPAVEAFAIKKAPTLADIVGSWRGDKGLETVRVFRNGTGLAVLSGGGTLKVRVAIHGDTVEIAQDQPNDVAMYRSSAISLETARKITAQARPMRWIFNLSADGLTLQGSKESIAVSGSGADIQVDNAYVRAASWTRLSR